MLLSKRNLAITAAAGAKDNVSSYSVHCVKVDPEKGECYATNSHSLYISKLPTASVEDYPENTGLQTVHYQGCVLLPADCLDKAAKNLPKKPTLAILECLSVTTDEDKHHLSTTDLDTWQDVAFRHVEGGTFPDIDQVLASVSGDPVASVGLAVEELERLVKVLKKQRQEWVRVEVRGEYHPVKVETPDGETTVVIMPGKPE